MNNPTFSEMLPLIVRYALGVAGMMALIYLGAVIAGRIGQSDKKRRNDENGGGAPDESADKDDGAASGKR